MSRLKFPGMLGFGGASLGNMYAEVDEAAAQATLAATWETGVRHFDTAPVYGRGLGERRFGDFLRSQPRQDYLLSTKVGRLMRNPNGQLEGGSALTGPSAGETALFFGGLPFRVEVDYGYDAAMRSFEDSCQRLGMNDIDIVYVHDLGADHLGDAWEEQFELALTGCFRALSELRDQGVIKAWGLGNNVVEPQIRALQRSDPDVLQLAGRYSLLDQSAYEQLFPMCLELGVPLVLGGTYNSDLLVGGPHYDYRPASPEMLARRDHLAEICTRHGVDLRAAALQFCAAHPAVASIIPGSKSAEKVRQNAQLLEGVTPDALWRELKTKRFIPADAPAPANSQFH